MNSFLLILDERKKSSAVARMADFEIVKSASLFFPSFTIFPTISNRDPVFFAFMPNTRLARPNQGS